MTLTAEKLPFSGDTIQRLDELCAVLGRWDTLDDYRARKSAQELAESLRLHVLRVGGAK